MAEQHIASDEIAVDLDGTLAYYDVWRGLEHIGAPIPAMVDRVKAALKAGTKVVIFSARVSSEHSPEEILEATHRIKQWCRKYLGQTLDVTAEKRAQFREMWDDRAKGVIPNTGKFITDLKDNK